MSQIPNELPPDSKLIEEVITDLNIIQVIDRKTPRGMIRVMTFDRSQKRNAGGILVSNVNWPPISQVSWSAGLAWLYNPNIQKIAVIGAGCGMVQRNILRWFPGSEFRIHIDAVDLESHVFELARKYFGYPYDNPRLKSHCCDGLKFLTADQTKLDFIFVDVFFRGRTPKEFVCVEFLKMLRAKKLNDGGVFAINIMSEVESPDGALTPFLIILKALHHVFGSSQVFAYPLSRMDNEVWDKEARFKRTNIVVFAVNSERASAISHEAFNSKMKYSPPASGWEPLLKNYWEAASHSDLLASYKDCMLLSEADQDAVNQYLRVSDERLKSPSSS